ncbi:energy transducer TonB [Bacteroides sp.]
MKKTTTTFLLLFLFSFRMMGQIDYLEPIKDYTKYKNELSGYYCNVFSLLNTGLSEQPRARYVALPSFSPEYTVSVETQGGKYYLVSNTLSQNSWQAEKNTVKVNRKSVEITKALYQPLVELLQMTTSQIQDMDGSTTGLDGTTYYFSATNDKGKVVTGKKWSPDSATLMGRLVQIWESVYALSIEKAIPENLIIKDAQALLKDLRNRNKEFPDEYKQPKYAGIFPAGLWQSIEADRELETIPLFPDFTPESYAAKHIAYPSALLAKAVKGYALCQFTIDRRGNVTNAHILKYSHPEFAEEALRVVKSMPKGTPAMSEDSPVACNYILYVPFRPVATKK